MTNLPFNLEQRESAKMHSDKREFILERIDNGKSTKDSSGNVDNRLFTGDNKLFAIHEPTTGMWFLRYAGSRVPESLAGKFTEFNKLIAHVTEYFLKRNVKASII